MDYRETVRAGYDAIAADYIKARTGLHPGDIELVDDLMARLPAGARVLDAGCGSGVPVTARLSVQFEVVGVDLSEEQVRLARENVPGASFVCGDMTALDCADETFDAICSFYAIFHVPRDEHPGLLASFHRMLKPSGLLLVSMGRTDSPVDIDEDFFGARMFWSHYAADRNEAMIQESGLSIIWSRMVAEQDAFGGGRHLFVLAEKE